MPTLEQLNIKPRQGDRADCPLCLEPRVLTIVEEQGQFLFNCLHCGQNGSSQMGWWDDRCLTEGYQTFDALADDIRGLYKTGLSRGITTGWSSVDELFTLRKRELTIIGGTPGHGKTTWLRNLAINAAHIHNWKWAIYSPEMMPNDYNAALMIESFSGQPFFRGADSERRLFPAELEKSISWMQEHFYFLTPKKADLLSILDKTAYLIRKKKIDALMIDPWNKIEHARPAAMSETDYIGLCLDRICLFAKNNNIKIFLAVHPTKLKPAPVGRDGKIPPEPMPTPWDLAGSYNWNSKPDNILCIYRNRLVESDLSEFHAQKIRWHITGKTGSTFLQFDPIGKRFMLNDPAALDIPPLAQIKGAENAGT